MAQLLIALDGEDEGARERRVAQREQHVVAMEHLYDQGRYLLGGPLRRAGDDQVIGSMIVTDFATRGEFNEWLRNDPMTVGGVWKSTQVFDVHIAEKYLPRRH